MMAQYIRLKKDYPDTLVLYRRCDLYYGFWEVAE